MSSKIIEGQEITSNLSISFSFLEQGIYKTPPSMQGCDGKELFRSVFLLCSLFSIHHAIKMQEVNNPTAATLHWASRETERLWKGSKGKALPVTADGTSLASPHPSQLHHPPLTGPSLLFSTLDLTWQWAPAARSRELSQGHTRELWLQASSALHPLSTCISEAHSYIPSLPHPITATTHLCHAGLAQSSSCPSLCRQSLSS